MARRTKRVLGAGLLALVALPIGYFAWGNWRLRSALRDAAADAGCELEYGSAYTLYPGHFQVEDAVLSGCDGGLLSLQIPRASGRVSVSSLFGGPVVFEHAVVHADAGRWAEVSWEGALRSEFRNLRLDGAPQFHDARLELESGVITTAASDEFLVHGLEVEARSGDDLSSELNVSAFADDVSLSSGPELTTPWLDDVQLVLGSRDGVRRLLVRVGSTSASIRDLEVITGIEGELDLSALDASAIVVDGGALRLPGLVVDDRALDATLELDELILWPPRDHRLLGRFALSGSDAGVLLDLLRASESVRMKLTLLEEQPFSLASLVEGSPGKLTLSGMSFEGGDISARGSLRVWPQPRQGMFDATYGETRIGVCVAEDGSDVALEPEPRSMDELDAETTSRADSLCVRRDDGGTEAAPSDARGG